MLEPINSQHFKMKRFCSFFVCLLSLFTVTTGWAQNPDSTKQKSKNDTLWIRTVISDRLNEVDESERAPSLQKLLKKANESYGKKNFYAAMKYFGFALKAEPLHVEALAGYGESAMEITSLDSAESAFRRLVDHGLSPAPDYFPKMRLAEVLFRKGKYVAAGDLFEAIATLPQAPPVPDAVKKQAKDRYELCLWAQGAGTDNPYIVKNDTCFLLDTVQVNTRELYSEYVAAYLNNQLYFSAYRFDLKNDKVKPKRNTIKLLQADGADGIVGPDHPMTVSETLFNDQLLLQHTAHLSINALGNTAYFAAGNYVKDSAEIRFDLFRRNKMADGNWGPAEKLKAINKVGYSSTTPSIGTLFGESQETLFFVSDRPGGKGGKDIWYSKVFGDSLGAPQPLKELNTTGNDVTPFFHSASNTLFFSSDSLPTLGGFDVYKSKPGKNGKWEKPEHMGAPINGSANDVYFVIGTDSKRGFFSSNRIGNANYSEEGCCYDVYAVDFITRYRAIALHGITEKSLPMTRITLYEKDNKGKYVAVGSPMDSTSSYTFPVKVNTKYMLIGEKAGFESDTVFMQTPDELWTHEIVDTVSLFPKINLVASVYDEDLKEPLPGPDLVFFDLGKYNKNGEFVPNEPKGKLDVLPENTHTKTYPLTYGHVYQVLAGKEGFVAPTSKMDSSRIVSTLDYVDGGTITVDLYLHRPSILEEYLPLTLYFDNDYPKKDYPDQDTILLDYQKTFVSYIRKKEEYKEKFASVLTGTEKQQAMDTLEFFFEKEVRMNWDSFFAFSDILDEMLQRGDTIILTLKGYASPLSNPGYNFHLTNRRIASVYNHFMIFDAEAFSPYREVGGNGQLKFIREPNGDTESVKMGVNGNPRDRRLSVYEVHAARSRKVQIIGARVSKGGLQRKM
ncbi:MAG: tetratricopeptide repeat protein [Saprospiraceae bacterium]|nr:tetratricopeptide repeat protein [Saprospiraceae bacterium]